MKRQDPACCRNVNIQSSSSRTCTSAPGIRYHNAAAIHIILSLMYGSGKRHRFCAAVSSYFYNYVDPDTCMGLLFPVSHHAGSLLVV